MNTQNLIPTLCLILLTLAASVGLAAPPTAPELNGLTPHTPTIYVNQPGQGIVNNGAAGQLGVAIANNGNVMISWGDSSGALSLDGLQQGIWTMYDFNGNSITPEITITSASDQSVLGMQIFTPSSISTKGRAFYRTNGTPAPGSVAGFSKAKANLFGPGLGFGASGGYLLIEMPEITDIALDDSPPEGLFGLTIGGWPVVQLFNNDGSVASPLLNGFSDADAQPAGEVRMADFEYLSNGNILIVGESRQPPGGPNERSAFRIVKPDGTEVLPLTPVSEDDVQHNMWNGAGVTKGRFALRFDQGGAKIRIFNNDGTPVTGNISLGTLTGIPAFNQGGRGDNAGWHGNGVDAYVVVNEATDPMDSIRKAWIAVINDDGTLRYARVVTDDVPVAGCDRVDGAIDAYGRAIAVYQDAAEVMTGTPIVRGRLFNANGDPIGGTFYVSETEKPDTAVLLQARHPRVAWYGNRVAVTWQSQNNPSNPVMQHVAARFFDAPMAKILSITRSGSDVIITWPGGGNLQEADDVTGPWTPMAGSLGSSPYQVAASAAKKFYRVR